MRVLFLDRFAYFLQGNDMKKSFYSALVLTLILPFVLCGCGPDLPEGMPPLTPCELTVTQGGAPLVGATIVFIPVEGTSQWNVVSITNETGIAAIKTNGQYDGAPAGNYKILVTKIEQENNSGQAVPQPGEPGYDEAVAKLGSRATVKQYFLVDKKFSNPNTTPLTINISGKTPIKQNIDTGKAVKIAL